MYDVVFEKAEGHCATVNKGLFMQKPPSERFFKKDVKFRRIYKKTSVPESLFCCFLENFAKLATSPLMQSNTGRLLLNIALAIVAKGVLYWKTKR